MHRRHCLPRYETEIIMNECLLNPITGGHGGGGSSSMFALAAGATTAFDSINLLSAPRVEYERPFYCFEL